MRRILFWVFIPISLIVTSCDTVFESYFSIPETTQKDSQLSRGENSLSPLEKQVIVEVNNSDYRGTELVKNKLYVFD
jgi:hypothetical protein